MDDYFPICFTLQNFKDDLECNFENFKKVFQDATFEDFIFEYKKSVDAWHDNVNYLYIDNFKPVIKAKFLGENISSEIEDYISLDGVINELTRKNLVFTFASIADFLNTLTPETREDPEKVKTNDLPKMSTPHNSANNLFPFYDLTTFENFIEYQNKFIVEPFLDNSYLFQRLKKKGLILHLRHMDFMKFLFNNGFISENKLDLFLKKESFNSLKKCTTPQRENNFNRLFNQM